MVLYRGSKWCGHVVPAGGVLLGDTRVQTVFANRKQARDAIVRTMDWWHGMQRNLDWPADAYSILNLVGSDANRSAEKAT